MNRIHIQGIIKDIQFSHYVADIEYYKANVLVNSNNSEYIVPIRFKRFSNTYNEGDHVNIVGNIRTYSIKNSDGTSHVQPYMFTYFDKGSEEELNIVELDGNICKKGELRKTKKGLDVIDFVLANNITTNFQKFNAYIPVVAWGKHAKEIGHKNIGDYLNIKGHFVSRPYKKANNKGDFDFHVAYEVNIDEIIENND